MDPPSLSFRLFICKVRGVGCASKGLPSSAIQGPTPGPGRQVQDTALQARRQHARQRRDTSWAMYQEIPSEQETLASRMDLSNQKLFVITPCLAFLYYEWGVCKPQQHLL